MKRRDVPVTASSLDDEISLKGVLMKRKDFFGLDENALSHPNRTYYLRSEGPDTSLITVVICCDLKQRRRMHDCSPHKFEM